MGRMAHGERSCFGGSGSVVAPILVRRSESAKQVVQSGGKGGLTPLRSKNDRKWSGGVSFGMNRTESSAKAHHAPPSWGLEMPSPDFGLIPRTASVNDKSRGSPHLIPELATSATRIVSAVPAEISEIRTHVSP